MIIRHFVLVDPVCNLVFVNLVKMSVKIVPSIGLAEIRQHPLRGRWTDVFDVSVEAMLEALSQLGPSALFSSLLQILLAGIRGGKPFKDEQPGEAESSLKAPFKDCGVHSRAVKLGPIDFEVSMAIL